MLGSMILSQRELMETINKKINIIATISFVKKIITKVQLLWFRYKLFQLHPCLP
jgi:hypothetical protein